MTEHLELDPLPTFSGAVVRTSFETTKSGIGLFKMTLSCRYRAWSTQDNAAYAAKAYYDVTKWRDDAKQWAAYDLKEGQNVTISGMPTVRKYTDKDGVEQVARTPELQNALLDESSLYSQDLGLELEAPAGFEDL